MAKDRVLEILKTNTDYISGEEISKALGVSRAAIWKDIKHLKEDGYVIDSITNKGYKLLSLPGTLDYNSIIDGLGESRYARNLIILDTVTSTNTYAKQLAMDGAPDGTIIIAKEQTDGRGRLGKTYVSPRDKGLYMSVILRPNSEPNSLLSLTAYTAVAIRRAIIKACNVTPMIKWINDLILGNKKIAGILTELSIEGESLKVEYIVLGIGINVSSTPNDFDESLKCIATSIKAETGEDVSLNDLAISIINELDNLKASWGKKDKGYFEEFKASCVTLNNKIYIKSEDTFAYATDITDEFGLVVTYDDGHTATKISGDIGVCGICGV